MNELKELHARWKNFTTEREQARVAAQGAATGGLEGEVASLTLELAQLRNTLAMKKAQLTIAKQGYSKLSFDAEWAEKKHALKNSLEAAIAGELGRGTSGYELANKLGTKNLNMIYGVKANVEEVREAQNAAVSGIDWKWSRFTGTQRYALGQGLVLMKGARDTDLDGQECVWDFETGAFVSGSMDVYDSDTAANRRKRADTLDSVLKGTYAGKVKESKNPYFEEVN